MQIKPVSSKRDGGKAVAGIDLEMFVVKPLSVKWLVGVYEFFQSYEVRHYNVYGLK